MNHYALLPLFGLLANLVLGFYTLLVNPKNNENRLFFLLTMVLAFWSLIRFLMYSATDPASALFWSRFGTIGATFCAVLILHFFIVFTRSMSLLLKRYLLPPVYLLALSLSLLDLTTNFIDAPPVHHYWGYSSAPGPLYLLDVFHVVGCVLFGLFFAVRYYRQVAASNERKQAKLLIVAISIPLAVGILTEVVPGMMNMVVPPLTTTSTTVLTIIVAYTMYRYKLMLPLTDQLKAVEKKYKNLFNAISDAIVLLTEDGTVIELNAAMASYLHKRRDDLIGKKIYPLLPEAVADRRRQCLQSALRTGRASEAIDWIGGQYFHNHFIPIQLAPDQYDVLNISRDVTKIMETEAALQESQKRLSGIVNSSPIPTVVLNKDHRITYWNQSLEELSGIRAADIIGTRQQWRAFYNEERPVMADLIIDGEIEKIQAYYRDKYQPSALPGGFEATDFFPHLGERGKWLFFTACPLYDDQGQITGAMTTLQDISGRMRAEEQLRKREAQYRLLAENANDIIWTTDLDLTFTYMSPSVERIRGYTPEEAMQLSLQETLTPTSFEHALNHYTASLAVENSDDEVIEPVFLELEQRCKDGTTVWTEVGVSSLRDEQGALTGLFGITRDITERKRTEAELRTSEEKYRLLAENANDVIWTMNMDMRFTYISPSVKQVRGYTPEEVMALTPEQTLTPESYVDALKLLNEAIEREACGDKVKEPYMLEVEEYSKDGSTKWMELSISWLRNEHGVAEGVIGISRDITERKRTERALKTAKRQAEQANEAKSQFLTNISHEIRTPMNGILGMTELLKTTSLTDEQIDYAKTISISASSLLAIINDLLDVSRIEAGKVKIQESLFDLAECVESVKNLLEYSANKKRLSLKVRYDAPEWVVGDKNRIRQILMNLVGNAVKFTDKGGVAVRVTYKDEPGLFRIDVEDSGIGIPEELQQVIFELFRQADGGTTRRYEGTGLGLTISKNMAELMGGRIEVKSRAGRGATFTVYLPLTIGDAPDMQADNIPAANYVVVGLKTLVVEDNPASRMLLSALLRKRGCQVTAVDNGLAALDKLRQHRYDVVFMDIQMPDPNGYKTTRAIRDPLSTVLDHDVTIVAVTAHALGGERERCLTAGMDNYIAKPISGDSLDRILTEVSAAG